MLAITLTVILIMPAGKEDVSQSREMPSIEECLRGAADWLVQDARAAGGIGFAAGCSVTDAPGEKG